MNKVETIFMTAPFDFNLLESQVKIRSSVIMSRIMDDVDKRIRAAKNKSK